MKKKFFMGMTASAAALSLVACGSAPSDSTSGGTAAASGDFLPCIVSDAGGFDDRSFNQLSYEGIQRAADELGVDLIEVESNATADFAPNLDSLVSEGCTAIVSVGFALSAATIESALANPDIEYILVDDPADADFNGETDAPNIRPLVYDAAQGAFLAGYLSAGYSETGKVGTFGGQPYPTVTIFMNGFAQGVAYYNEVHGTDVQVIGYQGGDQGSFTGGFEANDQAKAVAAGIIDQGVDVLLPVGGPIYQSAMDAIADSGRDIALIGVDADFYETDTTTQDIVLTSILKLMDVSVYEAVMAIANGDTSTETYVGTIANGGVGLAPLHNFEDQVDPALWQEVQELQQQIIDGEVVVTSYLDQ